MLSLKSNISLIALRILRLSVLHQPEGGVWHQRLLEDLLFLQWKRDERTNPDLKTQTSLSCLHLKRKMTGFFLLSVCKSG